MDKYRRTDVKALERNLERVRKETIQEIKKIQDQCEHPSIVADGVFRDGRRICAACGLEEVADYGWPSTTKDGGLYEFQRTPGKPTVLNSEFVKRGNVTDYRVLV